MPGPGLRDHPARVLQGLREGVGRAVSIGWEAIVLKLFLLRQLGGEHASAVASISPREGQLSLCEHCAKLRYQEKRPTGEIMPVGPGDHHGDIPTSAKGHMYPFRLVTSGNIPLYQDKGPSGRLVGKFGQSRIQGPRPLV